jgi:hypothetical protein
MRLPRPHLTPRPHAKRQPVVPPAPTARADPAVAAPAREPDDERAPPEASEAGFRVSSYELKRGLDVVELPTSLPPEVLDRLFKSR